MIGYVSMFAQFAIAGVCLFYTFRYARMCRRLDALDRLLVDLCIEAMRSQQRPIWEAWAGTMGDITVTVTAARKLKQEDIHHAGVSYRT